MNHEENKIKLSQLISIIRFPLLLGVVMYHGYDYTFDVNALNMQNIGEDLYGLFYYVARFDIAKVCTPCFFFISGLLFFWNPENFNVASYMRKMKKKIYTLLIPYLLWNVICWIYLAIKAFCFAKVSGTDCLLEIEQMTTWRIFWNYNNGIFPLLVPLWFMRDLMIVSIFTPAIYWLAKNTHGMIIFLIGLLYVMGWWPISIGIEPRTAMFFTLGCVCSICRFPFLPLARKYYLLLLMLALVMLPATLFYRECTRLFLIVFLPIVFASFSFAIDRGLLREYELLTRSTFFVYAGHSIVIVSVWITILSKFIPDNSHWLLLCFRYVFLTVPVSATCVAVYAVLKRISPKVVDVLSGNRG